MDNHNLMSPKGSGTLYEIIDMGEDNMSRIKLLVKPYAGLVYQYGQVAFQELGDGQCAMNFTYQVFEGVQPPESDRKFKNLIGDILVAIMDYNTEMEQLLREKELAQRGQATPR